MGLNSLKKGDNLIYNQPLGQAHLKEHSSDRHKGQHKVATKVKSWHATKAPSSLEKSLILPSGH